MYLEDGIVSGHEIGVNIQIEDYDTSTLQNGVIYNNRRNLAADDLPIPDPAEELGEIFGYVACSSIEGRGCCSPDGNTAFLCTETAEYATEQDCTSLGYGPCGWTPVGYACGGDGEDPSGTYPMVCPGMEAD